MSEPPIEYPTTSPLFPPQVCGIAHVEAKDSDTVFTVDFDTGICTCPTGGAWHWNGSKYVSRNFCNHKLKALASLIDKAEDDPALHDFYQHELGRRFNAFEAVSAFHKELRRGDTERALYWSQILVPHRGLHGVVAYMRNIIFEETRDLRLANAILKASAYGRSVSALDVQRVVRRFCAAPKKWELPWRLDIFLDEQRAYKRLAEKYTYEVAKGKDIIDALESPHLQRQLVLGFERGDRVLTQYGLKGWFKSKSPDHDHMKIDMLNLLIDVLNGEHHNGFEYDHDYALAVHKVIMLRLRNHGGVGYHELNALADALTGEPGDLAATLPAPRHRALCTYPTAYRLPLGTFRRIPTYAHDNHTWDGKRRMKQYGATQLRPGAEQTNIDFRLCGAYMGVAWRSLAVKQFGTIDCKWGNVKWAPPPWLWSHVDNMFY